MKLNKISIKQTNIISFSILFLTIFLHIYAILSSNLNRSIIYEPDDNYHQIIKSVNFKNCFIGDEECLGNKSIYHESKKIKQNDQIDGLYTHTILVEYHLVKSILINVFNSFLKDYEKSQKIITILVSSLFIILGFLLIEKNFGRNPSLIFLLINLPFVSIKYGYHFSHGADDLSTVFCLLILYFSNRRLSISFIIIILILFLLTIFSHPIGIFLISLTLIYELSLQKKINKNFCIKAFIFIISILIYFILKFDYYEVDENIFTLYNELSVFSIKSFLNLIVLNLKNNLYFFYDLNNLVNYFLLIILLIYYFNNFSLINDKYKSFLPFFISTIFFIFISLLHPQPFTSLLTRMQVLLFILISGLSAVLIFEILINIPNYNHKNKIVIKYVFYSILVISLFLSVIYNTYNLKNLIKSNQENLNLSLNKEEIISSLNHIGSNKIYILNKDVDDSVFNSIFYKFFYLGLYNKKFEILKDFENLKIGHNDLFYLIKPSIMLNKRSKFKSKVKCNVSNYFNCMNTAWYNPERIFNSDFILKDKDKLIFPKSDKSIEITFYSKDEFIINSNNKNLITKNKKNGNIHEYIFESSNNDLEIEALLSKNSQIKIILLKYQNLFKNIFPINNFNFTHISGGKTYDYNFDENPINNKSCKSILFEQKVSYEIYEFRC